MTVTTFDELILEAYPGGEAHGSMVDISGLVNKDLTISTVAPGGDHEVHISRNEAALGPPYVTNLGSVLRAGTKVIVRDDEAFRGGIFWVGRAEVPQVNSWIGGSAIQTIIRGYASHARAKHYQRRTVLGPGTNVIGAFAQVCDDLCPLITNPLLQFDTELLLLGRVLHEESPDYVLSSAQEIWNHLANVSSSLGISTPLLWRVMNEDRFGIQYNGGLAPVLNVKVRPQLGTPRYITQMQPGGGHLGGTRVEASGDLQRIYNRVLIKYDDPEGVRSGGYGVVVEPPGDGIEGGEGLYPYFATAEHGVGEIRDLTMDLQGLGQGAPSDQVLLHGGTASESTHAIGVRIQEEVRQIARMILSQSELAAATEGPIKLFFPQQVWDTVLSRWIPLWRIRAGEVIEVTDWRPYDGFFADALPLGYNQFYITGTTCSRAGATLQIGIRSGLTEAVGRALKAKQQGPSDYTKSALVPPVGITSTLQTWTDMLPNPGSLNKEAPYSNILHGHGTPNGDIAPSATFGSNVEGALPIEVGDVAYVGLIQSTIVRLQIAATRSGSIRFHVSFPPHPPAPHLVVPAEPDPGHEYDIEGGSGHELQIRAECYTGTFAVVTCTANPGGLTSAAVGFFGTRILLDTDPSISQAHGMELYGSVGGNES